MPADDSGARVAAPVAAPNTDAPANAAANTDAATATPVCIVVGMAGSGKTTLVNALACFLEDGDDSESPSEIGNDKDDDDDDDSNDETSGRRPGVAPGAALGTSREAAEHDAEPALLRAEAVAATRAVEDGGRGHKNEDAPKDKTNANAAGQKHVEPNGTACSKNRTGAYVVNLDPAVAELPYEPNVDIRDTVKYKEVMREYALGPNGAIITALNLFATRFDQVLALVERRAPDARAVVIDTPGQIETFTWSASGAIITEALAMSLPTVVAFVVDTARSQSAMTFVSNMLYACSIMYKTRLPMIVVFNKIDVVGSAFAEAWMRDFDAFDAALKEDNFAGTLARSMAQALEEFYSVMRCVSVSAVTEQGLQSLVDAIADAAIEYEKEYRPIVDQRRARRAAQETTRKNEQLEQLKADLDAERAGPQPADQARDTMWAPHDPLEDSSPVHSSPWAGQRASDAADVEAGKGSREIRALRSRISRGGGSGVGADPPTQNDAEPVDPEEAQAYADFVKYLEALEVSPSSSSARCEGNAPS